MRETPEDAMPKGEENVETGESEFEVKILNVYRRKKRTNRKKEVERRRVQVGRGDHTNLSGIKAKQLWRIQLRKNF